MSKIILVLGIVIVVLGLAFFFLQPNSEEQPEMMPPSPSTSEEATADEEATASQGEHVVVYSDEGYTPKELTIKKGDTVTFRSASTRETWPASAMHPSHSVYPGSSIQKCETEEMTRIFDACMGLKQGEEWSFVFDEVGTWWYHDHLNVAATGTIIVE